MCATTFEVLKFLFTNINGRLSNIVPTDREGLWLYPKGETVQQLDKAIRQPLEGYGWRITSLKNSELLIEPSVTRRYESHYPFMFHVSDRVNRKTIYSEGIQAKEGGNTTMNRQCPSRVFLAVDIFAAFEFVEFQCADKKRKTLPANLFAQMFPNARTRSDLDIWRVRIPNGMHLHRDVLFPGKAVWTDQSFSKQSVRRVRTWTILERVVRFLRRRGLL
jgi:hypothetical protein